MTNRETAPDARPIVASKSTRGVFSLIWGVIFLCHGGIGLLAYQLLPHGFPVLHGRFWANSVAPILICLVAFLGIAALLRRSVAVLQLSALFLLAFYFSASLAWIIVFPNSGKRPALLAILVVVLLVLIAWRTIGKSKIHRLFARIGLVLGVCTGSCLPAIQRAVDPATRPSAPYTEQTPIPDSILSADEMRLTSFASFSPRSATINARLGRIHLHVQPLLEFVSRSPDRGWTNFASRRDRVSQQPKLIATNQQDSSWQFQYSGNEPSMLLASKDNPDIATIEAQTVLAKPVFSHLNTFTRMDIDGHKKLLLTFSPCPGQPIEVTFGEYPVGRPHRFGYRSADGMFRVVEASSGEKGPFNTLAEGRMPRKDALTITFMDETKAVGTVTLLDFAAQASIQLSPTAGWGVPENSIEFARHGSLETAGASIWITLAGTSVGRGWDSVGHASGNYRNRIEISVLPKQERD